jgi:periplasmic divalent cation tolerance protein
MSAQAVVVMTTVDSEGLARTLGEKLLEARLAACVQEIRISSRYRWEGALQCDAEILLLIKTSTASAAAAMRCVERHHSYEVPEILAIPVTDGLPAYLQWLARESTGPRSE